MTTGIWITLIICGTLVLMSGISAFAKAHERKQVNKQLNEFSKAFKNFKNSKNSNNDDNDYFKPF